MKRALPIRLSNLSVGLFIGLLILLGSDTVPPVAAAVLAPGSTAPAAMIGCWEHELFTLKK